MDSGAVVIGDIHGDASRLEALLARLDLGSRTLIFLGDYIDRGPDSRRVLDVLCQLKRVLRDRALFLAGNHELAFLRYLKDGNLPRFAAFGGIATLRSYVRSPVGDLLKAVHEALPHDHLDFLEALIPAVEHHGYTISHTGLDPEHPEDRSMQVMAELSHPEMFQRELDRPVVCGHYVQHNQSPMLSDRLLCIDTGCGTAGGPLTALFLPERSFLQT